MPPYILDLVLKTIMADFGRVKTVDRETVMVGDVVVETGVRRVKLLVSEKQRHELPHDVNFEDGHSLLIVCAGSPPPLMSDVWWGGAHHGFSWVPGEVRDATSFRKAVVGGRCGWEDRCG